MPLDRDSTRRDDARSRRRVRKCPNGLQPVSVRYSTAESERVVPDCTPLPVVAVLMTLWCRGPARHPFKVEIEGSNPSRVANPMVRSWRRCARSRGDRGRRRAARGWAVTQEAEPPAPRHQPRRRPACPRHHGEGEVDLSRDPALARGLRRLGWPRRPSASGRCRRPTPGRPQRLAAGRSARPGVRPTRAQRCQPPRAQSRARCVDRRSRGRRIRRGAP
jgi:hypothetical protein